MHLSVEINEMPIKYDCSMTLLTFSERKKIFFACVKHFMMLDVLNFGRFIGITTTAF